MPPRKKLKDSHIDNADESTEIRVDALKIIIGLKNKEIETMKTEKEREMSDLKRQLEQANLDRHLVQQLREKVECPVCMEVPRTGPVPICPNGHVVCSKCRTRACPVCRVIMGAGHSLLAKTIIEKIEHKCRYAGCNMFISVDKIGEHDKSCVHRTVMCPYGRCNAQVNLTKLMDHIHFKCSRDGIASVVEVVNPPCVMTAKFTIPEQEKSAAFVAWPLKTYCFGDVKFGVFLEKQGGLYSFCFLMFSSETVCSQYRIDMAVHDYHQTKEQADVCFKFSGSPCSIDVDKKDYLYLGLVVNVKGMEQIFKKTQDNACMLSFTIKKRV